MSIEIKVPSLPESVADATVLEWHKQPGETIRRDENLVDLETDKIVLEVPAPADGVIESISADVGTTVTDGELLAVFVEQAISDAAAPAADESAQGGGESGGDAGAQAGPAVRKLLEEHQLKAENVTGSGKGGRILKGDVLAAAQKSASSAKAVPAAAPTKAAAPAAAQATALEGREESREPMSRIRQTIANRLVNAQQSTAMLTTFNEVDMSAILALRSKYKEQFEEQHQARLGFMSFFVKASVAALQRFPNINAHIDGTDIIRANYNDIGIAVSSPRGLVVPIIRDAQNMGFAQIENTIRDFGGRAQTGGLTMNDLTGGTFTITNGGVFGSLISTPILNPPQSAILGMHATQERPVAINGEVVVRPMMYLALSYDHRIVDGKEAVQCLVTIKQAIEDPTRLLLDLK